VGEEKKGRGKGRGGEKINGSGGKGVHVAKGQSGGGANLCPTTSGNFQGEESRKQEKTLQKRRKNKEGLMKKGGSWQFQKRGSCTDVGFSQKTGRGWAKFKQWNQLLLLELKRGP